MNSSTSQKSIKIKNKEKSSFNKRLIESIKAVGMAFLIGFILIMLTGNIYNIPSFIKTFFTGSFGDLGAFSDFLGKLSYMIPLGLSLAVSFRMGLFNIGSAGQMLFGGLIAFLFATKVSVFGSFGWIFVILIGVFSGAFLAFILAFLKNRFKINEVISSIMFNWIVFYILRYFSPSAGETSAFILEGNSLRFEWLSSLFNETTLNSQINIGIFISLLLIPIIFFAYKSTLWGYKQELIGNNINIGKYLGINEKYEILKTMSISGALAGLSGAIYFVGYDPNLPSSSISDIPGYAFTGITIALLGFNTSIGVFLSSILIATLTYPSGLLDNTIGSIHIVDIMIAVMILLMAKANFRILYYEKPIKEKKSSDETKEKNNEVDKDNPTNENIEENYLEKKIENNKKEKIRVGDL